jgi:hypothetical protein
MQRFPWDLFVFLLRIGLEVIAAGVQHFNATLRALLWLHPQHTFEPEALSRYTLLHWWSAAPALDLALLTWPPCNDEGRNKNPC